MKESKKQSRVIKRSGWSAFSLLAFLILGIGAPAFLYLNGESLFAKRLSAWIEKLRSGLPKDITQAEEKNFDDLLVNVLEGVQSTLGTVITIIAIVWIAIALVTVWVKIHNARQTRYRLEGNVIVCENGKVFSGMVENKRFIFTPGMSVYVQQSVKGKFFRYGTVCITMGMATAGEFRMEHVKRPNKVKKYLAKYLVEYAYSSAYTSAPFIVNPYAYANMFPGFYGMGMYPYGYMMPQANANGQVGAFPYSAAYGTAGTASPYNF